MKRKKLEIAKSAFIYCPSCGTLHYDHRDANGATNPDRSWWHSKDSGLTAQQVRERYLVEGCKTELLIESTTYWCTRACKLTY